MGYLTTFTIHNNGIHTALSNPKVFCQELYDAASMGRARIIGTNNDRIEIRQSRHADEHTVYAHLEGRIAEMVPWADETARMMHDEPVRFAAYAAHIEQETRKLHEQFRNKTYALTQTADVTGDRSTTFTIYNDGIHLIKQDPSGFVEILKYAIESAGADEFGFGNSRMYHGNLIKAHRTLPATQPSMYVHMGNTVVELANGSPETNELMSAHASFMNDLLFFTAHNARRLKQQCMAKKTRARKPRERT